MVRLLGSACIALMFTPILALADDDPKLALLMGKWELTEESAGMPKGTIFDFQKDGKLVVTVVIKEEKHNVNFKYELREKGKILAFTIEGKTETTDVQTLDKTDLICKDKDGTSAKFKRVK